MHHPAQTPEPSVRTLLEAATACGLVLSFVVWSPLDDERSTIVQGAACLALVGYLIFDLMTSGWQSWGLLPADVRGDWRRLELPRPEVETGWRTQAAIFGGLGLVTQLSILPALVVSLLVDTPLRAHPLLYLLWCVVQDVIFFVLIQRNLESWLPAFAAVGITAVLFGLSHLPYTGFALVTGVVAAAWGTVYLTSRALVCIIASHWLMGMLVLSA